MKKASFILLASMVILLLNFTELFIVPTGSMLPTIQVGSWVILNKFRPSKIASGDIVGFYYPNKGGEKYIKRVIGVAGDVVSTKYKIPKAGDTTYINHTNINFYKPILELHEGVMVNELGDRIFIDGIENGKYKFKNTYFFAQGDNTENSIDSRNWGLIPIGNIIGSCRR
jgi:signal peptidase I